MNKPFTSSAHHDFGRSFQIWTIVIVLLGLLLRVYNLGFSYSNDELSALSRVRFDSFAELVRNGFYVDGHPGGIQVFLYYWVRVFGMNEWAVRIPFALVSTLGIWFTIKVFSRWFGPSAGLLSGAFVAFLVFPVLYSQIARPYGPGLTFCMIMVWYWTRLLFDEKPNYKISLAFALSAAACMYTHYFSFLLALVVGLTGLFQLKKDRVWHYLGAGLLSALLFSPHIYITLNHLSIGGVGLWLAKPGLFWPLEHLFYIFNESFIIVGLLMAIMLIQILTYRETPGMLRFRIFSVVFFLVPMLVGFFYSREINPVLQHSVLLFSFPFLMGFLLSFSGNIPLKWFNYLLGLVLIVGTLDTVVVRNYFMQQHFGEFRGVAQSIEKWNDKYGADNITHAVNVNNPWYIQFYMSEVQQKKTTFEQTDNKGGADLDNLKQILDASETPFFLYAWTKPVPFEVRDMILARYPCLKGEVDFGGLSAASLFAKKLQSECLNANSDTLFFLKLNTEENKSISDSAVAPEFFPGFDGKLSDLLTSSDGSDNLVAYSSLQADELTGALLVVSFQDEQNEISHWSAARFDLFTRAGSSSLVRLSIPVSQKKLFHHRMKLYVWNPKLKSIMPEFILLVNEKRLLDN
ncbi:MAG: glycosyltransferase family 39 protein [Lentimicrobium sp.]|nr:glycosyltransferase family 39 protein [Lentimicrobium sp.]